MLLGALVVGLPLIAVCGLGAVMMRSATVERCVEREVAWIRREVGWGWNTERIVRHHPDFCECQVRYLRTRRCSGRGRP